MNQTKHSRVVLITAVLSLLVLAWSNRFIQDDAFISFRYAQNLAEGLGLVWGPGQVVEGYSNFLWTLLISGAISLNLDPISTAYLYGLLFFFLSLLFTYFSGQLILKDNFLAIIALLLLGTNFSFSSFATGGLETQMQTTLLLITTFLVLKSRQDSLWSIGHLLLLGLLFSAALLTRLDSAVLLFILAIVVLYEIIRQPLTNRQTAVRLLAWLLPILLIVGSWFLWRLAFYGQILPNTFYVKVSSSTSILRGAAYILLFLSSYWLLPFLALGLLTVKRWWPKRTGAVIILAAIIFAWLLYIIFLGGDFIEFRFMTPILPALMILLTWLIFSSLRRAIWQTIAILLIICGSLFHMLTFESLFGIGSIKELKGFMENPQENWDGIGRTLDHYFADCSDPVTIAVRPSGAIPYYSGLKTIDMLGLNDPWIARQGLILSSRPGHQRIAPFEYLQQQGVNLIIGHPVMEKDNPLVDGPSESAVARFMLYLEASNPHPLPEEARFLEIPIEDGYNLTVLVLKQNNCIDHAIEQGNWDSQ